MRVLVRVFVALLVVLAGTGGAAAQMLSANGVIGAASVPKATAGAPGASTRATPEESMLIRLENTLHVVHKPTKAVVTDYVNMMNTLRGEGRCMDLPVREERLVSILRSNLQRVADEGPDSVADAVLAAEVPIHTVEFGVVNKEVSAQLLKKSTAVVGDGVRLASELWDVDLQSGCPLMGDSPAALGMIGLWSLHQAAMQVKSIDGVLQPASVMPKDFDFVVEWGSRSSLVDILFAGGFAGKALIIEADPSLAAVKQYLLRLRGVPVMPLAALLLADSGVTVMPPTDDIGRVFRDVEGTLWLKKRAFVRSLFAALSGELPPPKIKSYVEVFVAHLFVAAKSDHDYIQEHWQSTDLDLGVFITANALGPAGLVYTRVHTQSRMNTTLVDSALPAVAVGLAQALNFEGGPLNMSSENKALIEAVHTWWNAMFVFSNVETWELGALSFAEEFHMLAALTVAKTEELGKPVNVCEVGFNRGTSALSFVLGGIHAQNLPSLLAFDLGTHEYAFQAEDVIRRILTGQVIRNDANPSDVFAVVYGNSEYTVPFTVNNDDHKCDIVFVDGGHYGEVPFRDIVNTRGFASEDTLLIVDDCMCEKHYCQSVNEQVRRAHRLGVVKADPMFPPVDGWFSWGLLNEKKSRGVCVMRYDWADKAKTPPHDGL